MDQKDPTRSWEERRRDTERHVVERITPEVERAIQRIVIDLMRILLRWDLDNPAWLDMHTGRLAFLKELYEARDPSTMQLLDTVKSLREMRDLPEIVRYVRDQRQMHDARMLGLARGAWPQIGKYLVIGAVGLASWLWMHFGSGGQ